MTRVLRPLGVAADAGLRRPWIVVAVLAAGQVALTLLVAASAPHNGWVYEQSPEATWYGTLGWLLGDLDLGPSDVGYGWPLVLTPLTWVTGPTYVQALPAVLVLNVLVLGPLAVACIYAVGSRVAGVLTGLVAAAAWVLAPFAAAPLWVKEVGDRWVDETMPQLLGLTALPDFPATVLLLVGALLVLRSLEPGRELDAAAAGLVIGVATAMRPACLLLAVGAIPAYLLARRAGGLAVFVAALAPTLVALAIWKQRGLGEVPLGLDRQSVEHWELQMRNLGEFFWSARLVQWLAVAGAVALALRRAWPALALLAGWLGAMLAVVGASPPASIEGGTFFAAVLPAWPAYVLLLAAVPLLVPTLARRLDWRVLPVRGGRPPGRTPVALGAVVLAAVPLGVVLAASPTEGPEQAVLHGSEDEAALVPVLSDLELRVASGPAGNRLSWAGRAWRADTVYRVYRSPVGRPDVMCVDDGAARCTLEMTELASTTGTSYVDTAALPAETYRVGVAAGASGPAGTDDLFAISAPVRAP